MSQPLPLGTLVLQLLKYSRGIAGAAATLYKHSKTDTSVLW